MTRGAQRRETGVALGLAHELGLVVSSTAAIVLVLLGGAFPLWVWLVSLAPVLSLVLHRLDVDAPPHSGTLLAVSAVGSGIAMVARGGLNDAVFAGGATLLGLTAARILTRRTLAHDLQVILLSLVLVLAGSVLNVGMSFFVGFVLFAIATVWALATRQLLAGVQATWPATLTAAQQRGYRQALLARTDVVTPLFFLASGALALLVLAAAIVVFVSFPRIGFGELGFLSRPDAGQLPSSVAFGGDPRGLSGSEAMVARVSGVPLEAFIDGLYLRAIIYDDIGLDAFAQSAPALPAASINDARPFVPLAGQPDRQARYQVTLVPQGGDLLFVLGDTRSVQTIAGGSANPNRALPVGGVDRFDHLRALTRIASVIRYDVRGSIAAPGRLPTEAPRRPPTLKAADADRYRRVPAGSDTTTVPLLREVFGDVDPATLPIEQRAERLRAFFLAGFQYALEPAVTGQSEALGVFLRDVRKGHCELFAGGFALLLRAVDVQARVVGGFHGGAQTDDDAIVFQQRHAHAWVEWFHPEFGWIVDDATPHPTLPRERLSGLSAFRDRLQAFWNDRVLDYALEDQTAMLRGLGLRLRGRGLGTAARVVGVAVGLALAVAWLWRRWRRKHRAAEEDRLARAILDAVARRCGPAPRDTLTLREVARQAEQAVGVEAARAVKDAVAAYELQRFGMRPLEPGVVEALLVGLRRFAFDEQSKGSGGPG